MTAPDPVIDELHEVRRRISARFGHDPVRLVEHYMEMQKEFSDRLVPARTTRDREKPAA